MVTGAQETEKVLTGLVNGAAYVFTVTARNAAGEGLPSAASHEVTPAPADVPLAPAALLAVPLNRSGRCCCTTSPPRPRATSPRPG